MHPSLEFPLCLMTVIYLNAKQRVYFFYWRLYSKKKTRISELFRSELMIITACSKLAAHHAPMHLMQARRTIPHKISHLVHFIAGSVIFFALAPFCSPRHRWPEIGWNRLLQCLTRGRVSIPKHQIAGISRHHRISSSGPCCAPSRSVVHAIRRSETFGMSWVVALLNPCLCVCGVCTGCAVREEWSYRCSIGERKHRHICSPDLMRTHDGALSGKGILDGGRCQGLPKGGGDAAIAPTRIGACCPSAS